MEVDRTPTVGRTAFSSGPIGSFTFGWSPEAEGTHALATHQYRNGKGWEKAASVTVEVDFNS